MGTELVVTVESDDPAISEETAELVHAEMDRLNDLLSVWNPDSPLSHVNQEARSGWAKMDQESYSLLRESMFYAELTSGKYDVTAGPLVRLWGFFAREERKPPQQDKIDAAKENIGHEKVAFDDSSKSIKFDAPNMEIDLGGIAKGYAVDKAMALLKDKNIKAVLINLGGNISFSGLPAGKKEWSIAVRDPRSKDQFLGVLSLGKEFQGWGIASSGQYERYFEFEGKRYGHIIDPTTGYPVENILGTTIIASNATRADALSTSAFLLGAGAGKKMIKNQKGVYGLVLLPNGDGGLKIMISREIAANFSLIDQNENVIIEEF